ncbi:MAG: glutathione S-transferase family protein [Geminicoccaceae bacterium]|jgi:glutathione S-transferase
MYTLYWTADSGAFAVQAVLEELGQRYRREILVTAAGDHLRPDYLALNPMAQVPTLRLPDGTLMTESAAMLVHLCDVHPEPSLLPPPGTSERARAYRWLFWLATGLYEADLRFYYADRYTADPQGAHAVRSAALTRMDRLLAIGADLLGQGPYVLAERFSAVDLYLFMLVLWHPARTEVHDRHPKLGELMRLVRRRPAVERIWGQHYPVDGDSPWSTWTGSSGS